MENNYIFCTLAGDKRYVNDPKYKVINKKDFIKCIDKHFNGGINWINQRNFYINVEEDLVKNVNCLLFFKGEQAFENYSYPYIINECKIAFIIKKSTPNKKIIRVDCEIDNFYDIDVFRDLSGLIKQTTLPLYTYYHTSDNNYVINQNILNKQNFDIDLEKIEKLKVLSNYIRDYEGFFYKGSGGVYFSNDKQYYTQAVRKPLNIDKNFLKLKGNEIKLTNLTPYYGYIDKDTFLLYENDLDKLQNYFSLSFTEKEWNDLKNQLKIIFRKPQNIFYIYFRQNNTIWGFVNKELHSKAPLRDIHSFNITNWSGESFNTSEIAKKVSEELIQKGILTKEKNAIPGDILVNGYKFLSNKVEEKSFWYKKIDNKFNYVFNNPRNLDLILLFNPQFIKYYIYSKNVIHQIDFSQYFIKDKNFDFNINFDYIQIEAPEGGYSYFKTVKDNFADVVSYIRNDLIVNNNFEKYFYENQNSINFQKEMIDFNIIKQAVGLPFNVLGGALNTQANQSRFAKGNEFINQFDIAGMGLNTIGGAIGGILGIVQTAKEFERIEASNNDKKKISTISSLSNGLREYLIYEEDDIALFSISINDNLINVLDFYFKKYGYVMSNYEKTIDLSYHHKVDYLEIIDLNYINKCSKEVNDYLNALFSKGIFLIFEDKESKDNLDNYMFLDKTILLGKENNPY